MEKYNLDIKEILENQLVDLEQDVIVKGWIVFNRSSKKIIFLEVNDGSTFTNLQVVFKNPQLDIATLKIGAAVEIKGKIVLTPKADQPLELLANELTVLKGVDDDYPIQKKEINLETLREIPHLRHRTQTFRAAMRVRSTLALEIHEFFNKRNFLYLNTPIITSNDGEGAGETFRIISEEFENFFDKKANLGVTGQLHGESYALGFKKIYTFGPTFRAENSHTTRHASEFWMIEPEMAFCDLKEAISLAIDCLKTSIKNTIEKLKPEMTFLDSVSENKLLNNLNSFLIQEITILEYRDAIKQLQMHKNKFVNKEIEFGTDLASEHEKFLCEQLYNGPVVITNFPKGIKAFYMLENEDKETVAAFDLLVPGIGELVGGSQRESSYDKLKARIEDSNMDITELQWYLDLRKYGYAMSSGFGIGFERLVMFVTDLENIRDSIPYPRVPGTLRM